MKSLKLDKCYLIAEIGVNHGGDLCLAKEMTFAAKQSGADAIKIQTFSASRLVSASTPKVRYQIESTSRAESHFEMIKKLEFSYKNHRSLKEYCDSIDIDFMSTPYDVESAKFLSDLGVEVLKTASADIVDLPLHQYIASTGRDVIISTGMSSLEEISEVISIYSNYGRNNIVLLHCVSNYPCNISSLNLRAIQTLSNHFGLEVGYSDHAIGNDPAVIAISLGAKVIEKHFTLDKKMIGPDHKASCCPSEFASLHSAIRSAEKALGSSIKCVQDEEVEMREVARKSLFLTKKIQQGDVLTSEHLTLKRPGTGVYSRAIPNLLGKIAKKDMQKDQMIAMQDFE